MTHPTSTGRQWTIRPALPADAPVLVAFTLREASDAEGRSLPVVDAERGVAAAFADPPKARYWVAEAGGLLLGSVSAVTEWSNFLGGDYWWVVGVGGLFTLARFSEAFLVLRAQQTGIALALVPLVMVAMNLVYALAAYPFGKLSDRVSHSRLLAGGLLVLVAADLVLAASSHWSTLLAGVALWGIHLGMTQGLLATMVADTAPADLRGTAFGFFNLVSGLAMLVASLVAGLLWDTLGAAFAFHAGAAFSLVTLAALAWRPAGARQAPARREG